MSVFDNNRTKCFIFVTWEELSTTYFVLSAVNGVFSVIAATLNALILLTVLKSPSLRTPSYIFLCNLAISDLAVGVCIQPLCSAVMALQGLGVMAQHCTLVEYFHRQAKPLIVLRGVKIWEKAGRDNERLAVPADKLKTGVGRYVAEAEVGGRKFENISSNLQAGSCIGRNASYLAHRLIINIGITPGHTRHYYHWLGLLA